MTLSITAWHPTRGCTVLLVHGVIDHHHAADLRAAISVAAMRRPAPRRIILDLHAVTSIDDLGIATLVVAGRICRDLGIDLAIRHTPPLLRQLLGMPDHTRHGPQPASADHRVAGRPTTNAPRERSR